MKTLANLEAVASDWDSVTDLCISTKQLKAAAIEWVKEINENYHKEHVYNTLYERGLMAAGKIEFIKQFFGLTEEDLK